MPAPQSAPKQPETLQPVPEALAFTRSPPDPRPQTTPSPSVSARLLRHGAHPIKTLEILVVAAAVMAALLSLLPAAGHDQLWFLLMGQRWLHGAAVYGPTLFDSNPPLIVWLSTIPVLIAEHLHLPPSAVGKLLVLLAEAASAALALHLLRRLSPGITRMQTTWLAFAYICIFAIAPARDFGQRDHLTSILCLPYILAAALDDHGASTAGRVTHHRQDLLLRTISALLAAIGICLKPHQALIPIAVELTRLFFLKSHPALSTAAHPPNAFISTEPRESVANRGGNGDTPLLNSIRPSIPSLLRPEPLILLLSGLAFLLLIRRFTPAYFTLALPTLRDTYWAIGHLTPLQLLAQAPQLHLLAALTLILFALRRTSPFHPASTLLLAAAIAATAAYYLQGTGWYYQQIPAISLFASALAVELLDLPALLNPPPILTLANSPWLPRTAFITAILAVALTLHFSGYSLSSPLHADRSTTITSPDPTFFPDLPPGTPVAILTTSVEDTMMPVDHYHLLWAQRTNNLWTLPAILRNEDPGGIPPKHTIPPQRLAALDRRQHAWMLEDLNRWQPRLILIARCQSPEVHCQQLEDRHDNLLAWFLRDPSFAQLWQHFRYLRSSGDYDAYTRAN